MLKARLKFLDWLFCLISFELPIPRKIAFDSEVLDPISFMTREFIKETVDPSLIKCKQLFRRVDQ